MQKTILILAANPKGTPRLRLEQEVREIEAGLQRAKKGSEFTLKPLLAARPIDVRRAMLDLKPSFVHFCGHGAGEEGMAFENETGQAKLVSAVALAGFFGLFTDKVECVVLNACYSAVQAEAIAQHIKYVVGMKKGISDTAAIEFAVAFYDALGAGETIEFAYKLARNAIQWADMPEHLTPVPIPNQTATQQHPIPKQEDGLISHETWKGCWLNPRGHQFDFELVIRIDKRNNVDGYITWTLRVSPLPSEQYKIGSSAREYVSGKFDPEFRLLTFTGYRADDPNNIIGMDSYRLELSRDGESMSGATLYAGTWLGKMSALRVSTER